MAKVFIQTLENGYDKAVAEGFEFCKSSVMIQPGDRICIKPNLTFPTFRKGVMTNPKAIEAVVKYLKNYTNHITICESDSGGYNRFSMDEVFRVTGIQEIAARYGVKVINMSYAPSRSIHVQKGEKSLTVPLPKLILEESDIFITMPVPKVHSNAIVSLAIKNQWGIIQEPPLRLKLHPYFKEVVYGISKALPRTVVIADGMYGLTRNGPMQGDAVNLNWLLLSDDIFCADYAMAELMGVQTNDIPYLQYIFKEENLNPSLVEYNVGLDKFKKEQFFLKRKWTDYPGVLTFNSRFLAYIGYESFLAKPLHWLLYKFRQPFYDYSSK